MLMNDEARETYQATVAQLTMEFEEAVARARGILRLGIDKARRDYDEAVGQAQKLQEEAERESSESG